MKRVLISLFLLFNVLYGSNQILRFNSDMLRSGNGNGIEIHDNYIKTGYQIKKINDFNEEYLRSLAIFKNKTYVGTGLTGKIYVVGDKTSHLFADSLDANINVIKFSGNFAYVGTSPTGYLCIIDGKSTKKFKTGEFSVNDLLKFGKKMLVATSSNGKILSFNGKNFSLFHQFPVTGVNYLKVINGTLFAFCSEPASVFALDNHGGIIRSYQFEGDEIADVSVKGNAIFVAVNGKGDLGRTKSIIYRITPNFTSCIKLCELHETIHSMALFKGSLILSAGKMGEIDKISSEQFNPYTVKIREIEDLSLSKIYVRNNRIYAISSHKGSLYEMEKSSYGYYITKPIYMNGTAKLTSISAISTDKCDVFYRIGNTSIGDSLNSKWKRYNETTLINESPTLFLQLKTDLYGNNKIFGFEIGYSKENLPPVIDSIVISPPGAIYTDGYFRGYNKHLNRSKSKRLKEIGFKIRNNAKEASNYKRSIVVYTERRGNDKLFYTTNLKSLYLGKSYNIVKNDSDHFIILNSNRYPDGTYIVAVQVKSKSGKTTEATTSPIIIDNSPPSVVRYNTKGGKLSFSVKDTTGLYDVEYSENGSKWKIARLPVDKIYKKETTITIPVKKETDFIILKLTDLFGNTGYFTIKARR